ncbi:copper amine oxidase N-terminal domain-containing protein [Paenibacillus glacialis]|uniref:Copper amine oxidase-like N-terminal domain-containing protein n=1 Tax=Paenibacillus glacialis TaxID=494026 RepID=A0A168KTE0_9BACL|nr:copper amine oxidase N-terminal domain-containing protein [Paenibacillus glacialis]OAB42440.1 hypothetical protein PGLA_12270 [Paenibacillus glacialis]
MKKRFLVALMAVMTLSFTSSQVFAKEQVKEEQTKVFVNGEAVDFTVKPLNEKGTTLVQFKPVFEKLGLKVIWNEETQTVTGSTYDLDIELTIGSKTAFVNGEKKVLTVAPTIVKDVTMIPLRFVGETSGKDVSWDGRTKTVYIASTKEQILHVIDQNLFYSQNEDLEGYMSTIDPSTPGIEQMKAQVGQINAIYDLKYEFKNIEVISVEKEKASVKLKQTTTKVSGPEFGDNQIDLIINLNKVNGEWKISTSKIVKIDYLKQDLLKESKITLSDAEQKKVLAVIEKNRASGENKDVEALKSTYDPSYENLDALMSGMVQVNAAFDLKATYSNVKIISNSADEAKVYYISTLVKVKGPEFANLKSESIDTLKKSIAGEWKIIKSDNLTIEYIQ